MTTSDTNNFFIEKIVPAIITAGTAVLGILIGIFIKPRVDFYLSSRRELRLLISEFEDMIRHINANIEVLDQIDLSMGIPAIIHLEKMKIPESSIIFSSDTYRNIYNKHSRLIYELRLIVRNINIEIDSTVFLLQKEETYNKKVRIAYEYLKYIEFKMNYAASKIHSEKEKLLKKRLKNNTSPTPKRPLKIIYH